MLLGIERGLVPPEPLSGNAYDQLKPSLPRYWPDAMARFRDSAMVREYLGEPLQRVFTLMKEQEMDEFDRQVTPLEYDLGL
jgi:glutamine synthetase